MADVQNVVLHTEDINGDGLPHGDVSFGFLVGDVNGNRVVDKPDADSVKANKNQAVNGTNFRNDINLSGVVDKPDKNAVQTNKKHALP